MSTQRHIDDSPKLERHFGVFHATALNITMVVGAGVFITIPLMLGELPGPWALLGWLVAGALMWMDSLVWGELGAALPGSGGTYRYLLESFGRSRWGRLLAFLFIWQFLISGPLETGAGLIAIAQFMCALSPRFAHFNEVWTVRWVLHDSAGLAICLSPSRGVAFFLGLVILMLLYRRTAVLAKLTVTFWLGVMGAIAWILVEGALHFRMSTLMDFSGSTPSSIAFGTGLGRAMILAMFCYLGYYNVCFIGDEVREPERTLPRSVLLSALIVSALFVGLHVAMLGTVSWRGVPQTSDTFSLAAEFMRVLHGPWAANLVTVLLIWSTVGSAFAGLLGSSRIPYAAAVDGHFFEPFGRLHPKNGTPHVALLLVGSLTLFWSFFDLQNVINALITTRILEQFVGQIVGVMLLRRNRPDLRRPFKIWLYPLPCLIALLGWLYMYLASGVLFIVFGGVTILLGTMAFLVWSRSKSSWPFRLGAR